MSRGLTVSEMSNAEGSAFSGIAGMASMSRWMVVQVDGQECLYGFADRHSRTGGLSWVLSTPIVDLNSEQSRAVTASGRRYVLGTRITVGDLNDEGRLAWEILVLRKDKAELGHCDLAWLVTCKWARHLRVSAPKRTDCHAVEAFLATYASRYQLLRTGESLH